MFDSEIVIFKALELVHFLTEQATLKLGQISNGQSEAVSTSTQQGKILIYYLCGLEEDPVNFHRVTRG